MKNESYILIVEDSQTQASHIESILKQLGHPVSIAYNGKEALIKLENRKPAIVVADILMPQMDGYELCKAIKGDDRYKEVPVVLLTQLSDPNEIIKGLECGADDFIVKPYNEELLLTRIQTILAIKSRQEIANREIKILIVEDSPTQAEQLQYLLEECGYNVTVAANGKEGLAAAKKVRPTLIISDILMPVMNGYEMAAAIKTDPEIKKTPIILVTSLMDRKEIARNASVVADGYFTKPYDDNYLLSKIEALISSSFHEDRKGEMEGLDVNFAGEHYVINSGRRQILTFLLSTYENAVQQNRDLILMQRELQSVNEQLEERVRERTEELQASEESFRALAENANDGIIIARGKDGDIVYVNKRISEITGYSAAELLKLTIKDLVLSEEFPTLIERFRNRVAGNPEPVQYETTILGKGQRSVPVEVTSSKTNWHGEPAVIAILRDVTDRRKREAEFIRTSKLESVSILAGGIAHDFNNLLTGIVGNASLAKILCKPEDKTYKILNDLEKASLRATDLTQQLLTFAKGGAPVKITASIAGLLKDSADFAIRGSKIKCDLSIPDDLWPVEVDEGQLSQVIHNLVINAEQAMPEGGVIRVAAENIAVTSKDNLQLKDGNYLRITVKDSGTGIPQELVNKVFDPYFTTKKGGSGLGLATVYSIIRNHDGYITVESEAGSGTCFYIYLPKSEKGTAPKKDAEERPIHGKGKILVMDDEEIVRTVAGAILTELGYDVEFSTNGTEAIDMYVKSKETEHPFDAVIMDLTISGGMGGGIAIKKLREIDPEVKAIVSSGYSDDPIMADYKKYGFSAVIAKPYKVAALSRTLREVLNQGVGCTRAVAQIMTMLRQVQQ